MTSSPPQKLYHRRMHLLFKVLGSFFVAVIVWLGNEICTTGSLHCFGVHAYMLLELSVLQLQHGFGIIGKGQGHEDMDALQSCRFIDMNKQIVFTFSCLILGWNGTNHMKYWLEEKNTCVFTPGLITGDAPILIY
ncbi:hypothetical protein ACJX0J_014009, partial [Zea mays]